MYHFYFIFLLQPLFITEIQVWGWVYYGRNHLHLYANPLSQPGDMMKPSSFCTVFFASVSKVWMTAGGTNMDISGHTNLFCFSLYNLRCVHTCLYLLAYQVKSNPLNGSVVGPIKYAYWTNKPIESLSGGEPLSGLDCSWINSHFCCSLLHTFLKLLPHSLCCLQASHFSLIAVFVCRRHLVRVIQGFI